MTKNSNSKKPLWLLVVLLVGAGISALLLYTAPETKPEKKTQATKIVQVIEVEPHNADIAVTAYGSVIPARQVDIKPQVGGRILSQHPELVPGGRIPADAEIISIESVDYQLALQEKQADLEEAKFQLAVEEGRQVVASREWTLLEKDLKKSEVNRSLVLREPHLKRAQAAIDKATNAIALAQLDLTRTTVKAPFNAVVITESLEVGQLIATGTTIATIAGTDRFWVQVTLPVEELRWIRFPDGTGKSKGEAQAEGAKATITLDTGTDRSLSWQGEAERSLGDLEPSGRMARVLVAVKDPLALKGESGRLPLLLGSYVRVKIEAGTMNDVLSIPRRALRSGDRLWCVDTENKLQIRDTELRWTNGETLLVTNSMKPGDRLIVSNLRTALPGMKVDPQPAPEAHGSSQAEPKPGE